MSNKILYIPILKWKRAEHTALKNLTLENKKYVTPLIELVLPTVSRYKDKERKIKKSPEELLSEMVLKFRQKRFIEISDEILKFWGSDKIFIDFSLLHDGEQTTKLKVESINKIITDGMDKGLNLTPVVNINDDLEIKKAVCSIVKKYNQGLCLRILPSDFSDIEKLNKKITDFLLTAKLKETEIDLLIDIKDIQENDGKYLLITNMSQQLNNLEKWRSFIFASGAFPVDLNKCKFDDPTLLPRFDWQNWLKHKKANKLKRSPVYSDYTIRNPIFNESLQFYHATTSIKYTIEKDWYILKGKKLAYELYPLNAKLLIEDSGKFYSENFSKGDEFIVEKSKQSEKFAKDPKSKGSGSNEDWIAAGINHHLTLVVLQVSSLL